MKSQVLFAMHPADEHAFEQFLVADESIRLIDGPRWKTSKPETARSLADISAHYCIIWSTNDISTLKAEYIPSCKDWYCQSEYATIQLIRSELEGSIITIGRIAVTTETRRDFPASSVKRLEKRYGDYRKFIKKNYLNSIVQWYNPTAPRAPAGPNHSANPGKPDPQIWVGRHALEWLREKPDRRLKQFRQGKSEAILVAE